MIVMKRNNSCLRQKGVLKFQGVLCYDDDLSATTYIIINGCGNWSCYQRAPDDTEDTEMDRGAFSRSIDEDSTYYTDSTVYPDLSIRVFEFDEGVLLWNEDVYYREKR